MTTNSTDDDISLAYSDPEPSKMTRTTTTTTHQSGMDASTTPASTAVVQQQPTFDGGGGGGGGKNGKKNNNNTILHPPLPKIISVTFTKRAARTKLGMILKEGENGEIYVSELKDVGMLRHSPVSIGDQLLLINRVPCTNMDKDTAVDILRNATGRVTIVFHNANGIEGCVVSMVEKPIDEKNVGIAFEKGRYGDMVVSEVATGGPYVDSLVAVRDTVIAINGNRCDDVDDHQMSPMIAEDIMRKSLRFVTIQAKKHFSA